MSDPLDIVGFIIGVIGLLAVVCQLLYWTVQNRLPKAKLRVLEETLEETENFLTRCVEEGRLTDERKAVEFRDALDVLKRRISELRVQILRARTYTDDLRNMANGLSQHADDLCKQVRRTQADISRSSSSLLDHCPTPDRDTSSGAVDSTSGAAELPSSPLRSNNPSLDELCDGRSTFSGLPGTSTSSDTLPSSTPPVDAPAGDNTMPAHTHMFCDTPTLPHESAQPVQDIVVTDEWKQPLLRPTRRDSVASCDRTSRTRTLRRKKQGSVVSRARTLARYMRYT